MPVSLKCQTLRLNQRWKVAIEEAQNRKLALRVFRANNSLMKVINETQDSNGTCMRLRLKVAMENKDNAAEQKLLAPHQHGRGCNTRLTAHEKCNIILLAKQLNERRLAMSKADLEHIIADAAK